MLTIALEKVDFLPANRVTDDTSILTLKNLVFEPLLRWLPGGQVAPALFSHWTHADHGCLWEFFIRPDARFHDGVLCAPAHIIAFVEGILRSLDLFGMPWSYARYLADARISAGADSIVVENPEPLADILDIFSEFYICRPDAGGRPVLGTGPYRVGRFEAGAYAALARVSGSGPDTIAVECHASAEARYDLLKAGSIDAALNLERLHGAIQFDPGLQWGRAVNTLSVMYYLNAGKGLFSTPGARLAANHAIDKQALIETLFAGLGTAAATVVSPFHLGMAAPIAPIAYEPDTARRLLDQAGGPISITLRTPLYMPERAPQISQFVAHALGAVGIAVTIETEADRPEYARQIGRKQIADMAIFDSSPQSTYRVLDDKISSRTRAVWWQGYADLETDRLIAIANQAVEPAAREHAYGQCLRRLNANPAWLYLLHPTNIFAARSHCRGLGIDHKGILTIS